MFSTIILFLSLFITWVIFSGFFEPFFLVSGAVSCLIAVYVSKKMNVIENKTRIYLNPHSIVYFFWLCKEIFLSSVGVALMVWRVKCDVSPVLLWISASHKSDIGTALYANSITLTPGTICINVKDDMMQVHAISSDAVEGLLEGSMDRKVMKEIEK